MVDRLIEDRTAHVAVVGLGYVGLPLALRCAAHGFSVTGTDHDGGRIAQLKEGRSPITSVCDEEIQAVQERGGFRFTSCPDAACAADILVLCLPTPLDGAGAPDPSGLLAAVDRLGGCSGSSRQLIILESTVRPQFTSCVVRPRLEADGRRVGEDLLLGYSPERADPAMRVDTLFRHPRLTSGITAVCSRLTAKFYQQLKIDVIQVSSPDVAEAAKILENTYRDVNIALVNEMAMVLAGAGIDVREVISAAATKSYGFAPFFPGHGVGGHCIPVDSVYYSHWARDGGIAAELAEMARKVNRDMPAYAERRIASLLRCRLPDVSVPDLLFMGITYKADVDDVRGSPTLDLMERLADSGFSVSFHDPYIEHASIGGVERSRVPLSPRTLREFDCIVLAVPHSVYEPGWINDNSGFIIDLTGVMQTCRGFQGVEYLFENSCSRCGADGWGLSPH